MSGAADAGAWEAIVQEVGSKRELTYDAVGTLNPPGGPAALCPGGTNRLVGQLSEGFWGASCDADEREEGRLFSKTVVPQAVLARAHVPDLAQAMPPFNIESLERSAEDVIERRASRHKVQFESIEFNQRFLATVPSEYDPIALREMFGPGFLDWVTTIDREVDFGVSEGQLYFHWRLRERTREEYETALDSGAGLFTRVCREVEEHGVHIYLPGPWHAGLEPFPDSPLASAQSSG
ncbi:MAG TPA: hypothetical protein VIZ31_04020 [Vicinamibacteria bacterium]